MKVKRISIERCRAILGKKYEKLSDQEIDQLRTIMEIFADCAIKAFLEKNKLKKTTVQSKKELYNG